LPDQGCKPSRNTVPGTAGKKRGGAEESGRNEGEIASIKEAKVRAGPDKKKGGKKPGPTQLLRSKDNWGETQSDNSKKKKVFSGQCGNRAWGLGLLRGKAEKSKKKAKKKHLIDGHGAQSCPEKKPAKDMDRERSQRHTIKRKRPHKTVGI